MRSILAIFAGAMLVTACNGAGSSQRLGTPTSTSATLSLKSAVIEVADPTSPVTVSCRGGGLCRETVAPAEAKQALDEAKEDCGDRGGLVGTEPCPRIAVRASCTLGGGAGPIRLFTYDEEIVSRMDDLCSAADGQFERR